MLDLAALDLGRIFSDPRMFASRCSLRAAGFEVLERSSGGKIMVGWHPAAPGVLFKKYGDDCPREEQAANYARRVEGARRLRGLVEERGLLRVVVPQKRIWELPRSFSRGSRCAQVLVVERLEVLGAVESARRYAHIDEGLLEELCVVVHAFRGLDSNCRNVPLTEDGRVAFVDTEHWDRHRRRSGYLHRIREHLSRSGDRRAARIFAGLDRGR